MPPKIPPDVPGGFDDEDWATLREMVVDYRRRQAFRDILTTYGKYLLAASGALLAITQLRDFFKGWIK